VVHCAEQAVGIRRKVDSNNFGRLIGDDIKETRVLMSESVVILAPDRGCKQDVERSNLLSPGNFCALLEPLCVLVDHRVNNVNKRLVTVEQTCEVGVQLAYFHVREWYTTIRPTQRSLICWVLAYGIYTLAYSPCLPESR
jgi:hypothetical protein